MGTLTETDESPTNKSSISFILEHGKKQYLFLGDATVDGKLLQNIEKIVGYQHQFTAIKLPHHGSRYNITREFIDRYPAEEYYCLTNSKRYSHPDLEVLAAIACRNQQKRDLYSIIRLKKLNFLTGKNGKANITTRLSWETSKMACGGIIYERNHHRKNSKRSEGDRNRVPCG